MNQDTIDIRGLFKNMQSIGFSLLHCLCEKIDNSISAGATHIKITIDNTSMNNMNNTNMNLLIVADDANGMNIEGLHNCGTVNRRTDATHTKHGRFGAGGNIADIVITCMGKVHYISKPKDDDTVYEMPLNYDVVKMEDYKLNPHEASRKTEDLWQKYAINKESSGTVQLMFSNPTILKELITGLKIDNITGDRFKLGSIYYEQLHRGLKLSFQINETLYPIEPIDRSKYAAIHKDDKQKVTIRAYQLANSSSYRFYYSDASGAYSYREFTQSKRGKNIKEAPEKTLHKHLGDIVISSTYHANWCDLIKPDLDKMQLKTLGISQDKIKLLLGGINVFRNEKLLAQFPSSRTGLSAGLIPYFQNSHHMIAFKANDQMDKFFDVLVNKSNLVEQNIQQELLNTIEVICDGFASKMKRNHEIVCQKCKATDKCACPPPPPPPPPVPVPVVVCQKCKATDKCACPSPPPVPVPVVICQKCKAIDKCACPPPPPPPPAPVVICQKCKATDKCACPPPPPPPVPVVVCQKCKATIICTCPSPPKFEFSKSENNVVIWYQKKNIFVIPFVGRYEISETFYKEILMNLGDQRFMEWIEKSAERGVFEHNKTYFSKK